MRSASCASAANLFIRQDGAMIRHGMRGNTIAASPRPRAEQCPGARFKHESSARALGSSQSDPKITSSGASLASKNTCQTAHDQAF